MTAPRLKAFISYSRRDIKVVDQLIKVLEARGIDIIIDRRDLPLAVEFQNELLAFIRQADTIITVLSSAALDSTWCAWEIEQATLLNKRIAPVVIEQIEESAIPDVIQKINYVFFTPGYDFETQASALADALLTDVPWLKEHTRLAERARLWDEHGRSGAFVLRGRELEDAEAWTTARPVQAPPLTELHQKFIVGSRKSTTRRQRILVGTSIAVAVMAIGLALFAEFNRNKAVEQRKRAESVVAKATDTANKLVFELANRFKEQIGVPNELIITTLGLSKELMEDLTAGGETQAEVMRSRAIALMELSAALRTKGDAESARKAAETAVSIFDRILEASPRSPDLQKERSAAHDRLGDAYAALGDRTRALSMYEHSLSTIKPLAQAHPERTDLQRNLTVGYEKIADLRAIERKHAEALDLYQQSLEIRIKLASAADMTTEARRDMSVSYEKIGNILMLEGRTDEALDAYRQSLDLAKALVRKHGDRADFLRDLASSYQHIGNVLQSQGLIFDALAHYRQDLEITTQLAQSDKNKVEWQRDLAVSYQKVGDALHAQSKRAKALQAYGESCSILDRLAGFDSIDDAWLLASCMKRRCNLLVEDNKAGQALRIAEIHIQRVRQFDGQKAGSKALLTDALGNAAWYALLARKFRHALDLTDEALAKDPRALWIELNKAHALMLTGSEEAAMNVYQSHVADTIPEQGSWREAVLNDFRSLRRAGIRHPEMARIEAALVP